jgi:AmiR/NasT family two-component response regulator
MSIAEGETPGVFSSDGEAVFAAEPPLVFVVGRSRINSIVVGRIAERSGLRSLSQQPEQAMATLSTHSPAAVILDGGSDNRDCDAFLETLKTARGASGCRSPVVILLSTRNVPPFMPDDPDIIDAVVAKPILPEMLQPVLDRLLGRSV